MDCTQFTNLSDFHAGGHSWVEALVCRMQTSPLPSDAVGSHLWWIIALPLIGAFICGVFGKMLGRANTHLIACCSVLGSFIISLVVLWCVNDFRTFSTNPYGDVTRYAVGWDYGVWFAAGNFRVDLGLLADHLSTAMLLVITGIGFLIHLYSTEYMSHDEGYSRFFAYLNLFVAMMLTLVLADSLVLLFVGWEGVGMCSYLLIGFWYEDAQKAFAGRKAFITNRIGDFGFLLASFLMVALLTAFVAQATNDNFAREGRDGARAASTFKAGLAAKGPLSFAALETFASAMPREAQGGKVALNTVVATGPLKGQTYGAMLTVIMLLFLLGAAGKSAQIPLFVWLPDAMAGPTPVSALIHAATMVTAGVYLFCRMSYLVVLSPMAMAVIAVIGGLTALLAALIAFAQEDLKKVLAYSTVSQLGFMFMAVGAGVFWAAFLHVVTHAFFKACLFLGAGSVMHGNADEGNIRKLGGLKREMKFTWVTFAIATCAITGVVPLSGFFSKDSILHGLHTTHLEQYPAVLHAVWYIGLLTAACTAFYMTRLYVLTFEGERAKDARVPKAHESGPAILFVLGVLAFGSVAAIAWGFPFMDSPNGGGPKQTPMENYLWPVFNTAQQIVEKTKFIETEHHEGLPWGAWALAWVISAIATAAAFFLYRSFFPARAGRPIPALEGLRKLSYNKFYVDELYDLILIRPVKFIAFISYRVVDAVIIDTVGVRGTAWLTARFGSMLRYAQSGDAQSYAAVMAVALVAGIVLALWGSLTSSSYDSRLLNLVIFAPLAFAAVVMLLPKNEKGQIRVVTFLAMVADLVLSVLAYSRYASGPGEFRLEYWTNWVPEIGLSYHVGIDGIAASLVLLTGILGPLVVLASWTFIQDKVKEFHLAILVLQTAMMGALCSLDILLFYVFFEAMLIPMYLLIGVWGSEERQMAAMKFFLYTLVGSLLMLVALLGVYFIATPAGQHSFDYAAIYNGLMNGGHEVTLCMKQSTNCAMSPVGVALLRYGPWMFFAFALAFAIKVPMWPVHTWLPDAHTQAPVAGSMILAAVMLKMGTFGFWRFAVPLFPAVAQAWKLPIAILAVIGIVYGALMCLAQRDIKRLIAYSSVSHLGYCMLGLIAMTPEAATGSAYQMLNHGVSTGALFLLFGMIYERRHVRLLSDYGGLAKVMPVFTAFFVIITFSSVAVPGTNGFIGEFLVLLGTFNSELPLYIGVLASLGVVLGAVYMLLMVQKVFFGTVTRKENQHLSDLNLREIATALPFVILCLVMGLKPQPFLDVLERSTKPYIARATLGPGSNDALARVVVRPAPGAPAVPTLLPAPAPQAPLGDAAQPAPGGQAPARMFRAMPPVHGGTRPILLQGAPGAAPLAQPEGTR